MFLTSRLFSCVHKENQREGREETCGLLDGLGLTETPLSCSRAPWLTVFIGMCIETQTLLQLSVRSVGEFLLSNRTSLTKWHGPVGVC